MDYKFKGWDVIGHKWVYGDLVHNQKVTRTGLEPRTMVGGYEVDPHSVGLFCCKDKYGREVYAGDVVRTTGGRICSVTYYRLPERIGFHLSPVDGGGPLSETDRTWYHKNLEVVSNIYNSKEYALFMKANGIEK